MRCLPTGIVNELLVNLGILDSPINFFANPSYFWQSLHLPMFGRKPAGMPLSDLAAITSIDPSLYEAATLDGGRPVGQKSGTSRFLASSPPL